MLKQQIRKLRANRLKIDNDDTIFDRISNKGQEVKELISLVVDRIVPLSTLSKGTTFAVKVAEGLHSIRRSNTMSETKFSKFAGAGRVALQFIDAADVAVNKEENSVSPEEFLTDAFSRRISVDSTIFHILIEYAEEKELVYERVFNYKSFDIGVRSGDADQKNIRKFGSWKGSIDGILFGWVGYEDKQSDSYFYCNDNDDLQAMVLAVKRIFWNRKSKNIVMNTIMEEGGEAYRNDRQRNSRFVLEDEEPVVSFSSGLADRLAATMVKYQAKNLHRTVLLYGPPGTGKTTAIREFVNNSGLSSLRIPVGFLNTSSHMSATLRIIQPDIIIIDDFDRVHDQGKMLDLLTDFKKVSKCVLLSCNSLKLTEALLRPGRIDEIIEHRVLNKEVIDRVLGPYVSRCDDSIRQWPIAYIEEFVKRADVLGIDDALTSFKELEERNRKANISWRKEDFVPSTPEEPEEE